MAEKRDNAEIPESAKSPEDVLIETKEEELRAAQREQQAKGGAEAKEPSPKTHTPDGVSQTVRDIRGKTLNLQQGNNTFNINILHNSSEGFGSFEDTIKKIGNGLNQFGDAYEFVSQMTKGDAIVLDKDGDTHEAETELYETPEQIKEWYCEKLNEWETCFVQAAVVLHGAPVDQIRDAAETLYHPLPINADGTIVPKPIQRISEKTLHTRLYMKIVYTQYAERLFWSDANTNGLSTFAVRLLPIIVRQSNLSVTSQQGLHFLKQLEKWSTTLSGECAWRATRALGGVWLKLHRDYLLRILNEWAGSDDPDDWRRAATLLDGAYEVEYAEHGEQINQGNNSFVLSLLARWTKHAHASFQVNVGSTVAQAYGRIGQRSISPALEGLEKLLRYPLRRKDDRDIEIPLFVFVAGTWSYITLARFGYVREVLQHLASLVEKYCYQRQSPQGKERREYRAECSLMLEVIFHIFFIIAAVSLNGVKDNMPGNYKQEMKLEQHPILPDKEGKDMLLTGILSHEEADWRHHIITILCGAILEKNAESAFYLMKIWAEIVLKELGEQRLPLREAFIAFMLELEERGNEWCQRLVGVGEYYVPDLFALNYKRMLQKWQIRKSGVPPQPLGAFAKDVSRRLNF